MPSVGSAKFCPVSRTYPSLLQNRCESCACTTPREAGDHHDLFLEVINVERLDGNAPPEGFWFTDLLKRGVLGKRVLLGTPEEIAAKQAWLRAWGYGEDDSHEPVAPFEVRHSGLLTWPDDSMGRTTYEAQTRCHGTLVPLESLYAATTFGLLALELLTTTGMRMNELMQVSLLPACLVRLVDDAPCHRPNSTYSLCSSVAPQRGTD